MIAKHFNALDVTGSSPAEAGTPYRVEIQRGMRYGVPPSCGEAFANSMIAKKFNAPDVTGSSPAKAGTPNLLPHGVPPLGGGAFAHSMHMDAFSALAMATALPAIAGTPCEAEIQQGMKELEGMLK